MAELPKCASSESYAGGHSDSRVWTLFDCRADITRDASSLLGYGVCRLVQLIEGVLSPWWTSGRPPSNDR
jgi:hypothetical protein